MYYVCMYIYICIYIYIYVLSIFLFVFLVPGTCLSSISSLGPSKTRSFPIKTRVIWVPGIIIPLCFIFQILRPDLPGPVKHQLSQQSANPRHPFLRSTSTFGPSMSCLSFHPAGTSLYTTTAALGAPHNHRNPTGSMGTLNGPY